MHAFRLLKNQKFRVNIIALYVKLMVHFRKKEHTKGHKKIVFHFF